MKLSIFTKRWGHDDEYYIERTASGWIIENVHPFLNGKCNKRGEPFLFENLEHDNVMYPAALSKCFEALWEKSVDRNEQWLQERLTELSEWIKTTEISAPRWDF